MKWPWVSREAYALACLERDSARTAGVLMAEWWAAEAKRWEDRYDALRESLIAKPGVSVPSAPIERELPDDVVRVIREQADFGGRTDEALVRHLRSYAKTLKRDGLSPDEIIGKLVKWQTFDQTEATN